MKSALIALLTASLSFSAFASPHEYDDDHHDKHDKYEKHHDDDDDDHYKERHEKMSKMPVSEHKKAAMMKLRHRYEQGQMCLEQAQTHKDIRKCMHGKKDRH